MRLTSIVTVISTISAIASASAEVSEVPDRELSPLGNIAGSIAQDKITPRLPWTSLIKYADCSDFGVRLGPRQVVTSYERPTVPITFGLYSCDGQSGPLKIDIYVS